MRGYRPMRRAAITLLSALGLLLSVAGCGPDAPDRATPTASPRTVAAKSSRTPKATATATPQPPPTPTLTPRIIREHVHRDFIRTPCFGGLVDASYAFVRWSADGSSLVFSRDRDVFWVAPDGSALRDFAVVGPMTAVDASPDGTQVVYSTCAYRTDPQFTYTPSTQRWTDADGNSTIVISTVDPNPELLDYDHELVRVNIDGSEPQRLTTNTHFDNYPAWSPDGARIAFVSGAASTAGAAGITITSGDGSDTQTLNTGLAGVALHPPAWSPDGRRIAFASKLGEEGRGLYTIGVDGADLQRLTQTVSGPSWSPDGQRLAFAMPDGAEVALYTIAADGTNARRVTPIAGWQPRYGTPDPTRAWIETVAWSPDGSKILYSCAPAICVVDLESMQVIEAPLAPRWSQGASVAVWSPDGTRIATLDTGRPDPNRHRNPIVQTMAPDGSDVRVLVLAGLGGPIPAQSGHEDVQASQAACAAGFVVDAPAENPGLVRDCETLLGLRDNLFGGGLVNWGPGVPITQWQGVTVAGTPSRVVGLMPDRLASPGPLPPALGDLQQLRVLTLAYSGMTGSIPPELGDLTQLQVLVILGSVGGRLSGGIPAELGQLTNLLILNLRGNHLTGEIPAELGRLTNLLELSLNENQLTGAIPAELGQLTTLTDNVDAILDELTLNLADDFDVTGIPWGQLLDFTGLSLHDNQLTGPIPPELGRLTQLTELNLYNNQLSGSVPAQLGQSAHLRALNLSNNRLTGSIPPELGQIANLQVLGLSGNQLTGAIPTELSRLTEITELFLDRNQLTGHIPGWLGQLVHLEVLSLAGNQLTGTIPVALSQLPALRGLSLAENQLTGTIPVELSRITVLHTLFLNNNQLTGAIPAELGELEKLSFLRLDANQLTGCIPPALETVYDHDLPALGLPYCESP